VEATHPGKGALEGGRKGRKNMWFHPIAVNMSSLGIDCQVVEHVMRGTREEWMSQEWQNLLSTPQAMVNHFCPITKKQDGTIEVPSSQGHPKF